MAKPKTRGKKKAPLTNRLSGLFKRGSKPEPSKSASSKKTAKDTPPPSEGLSLDRKLDITGVLLAFVGVLTLFSLLSPDRSGVTNSWVTFWKTAIGWGVYIFPLALILIGVWLVARNFEIVPRPDLERMIGLAGYLRHVRGGCTIPSMNPSRGL